VVKENEAVKDSFQPGLKALESVDRKSISSKEPRYLRGSINLDKALKKTHPNDPRWDYGIAVRTDQEEDDRVVWVEVHPASSNHVDEVIRKHQWLKCWLSKSAPLLQEFETEFVWVSSGKVTLPGGSPQRRRVALCGIRFAGERLEI
jgi:hypothetical protein